MKIYVGTPSPDELVRVTPLEMGALSQDGLVRVTPLENINNLGGC